MKSVYYQEAIKEFTTENLRRVLLRLWDSSVPVRSVFPEKIRRQVALLA